MTQQRKLHGRIELSNDTRILYNVLESQFVKEGAELVPYAVLTAAIGGRDVQGSARGLLTTARKNLVRDYGILTESVTNSGIRRVDNVAVYLGDTKDRIGRLARRKSRDALNSIAIKGLPDEQKVSVYAHLSIFGTIGVLMKPKALEQVQSKIAAAEPKELPSAETLRLFSGNGNGGEKK